MSDKMREEFEAWAGGKLWPVVRNNHGEYVFRYVEEMWEAWQAATPKAFGDGYRAAYEHKAEKAQCPSSASSPVANGATQNPGPA